MTSEDKKYYYNLFSTCWKFFWKYAQIDDVNDNQWNAMINDAEKIRNDYDGNDAAYQILWGAQQALDKIWTKKEKQK